MDKERFKQLYDGSLPCWVILRTPFGEAIYHEIDHVILVLSDVLRDLVIEEMRAHGVRVVEGIPQRDSTPEATRNLSDYAPYFAGGTGTLKDLSGSVSLFNMNDPGRLVNCRFSYRCSETWASLRATDRADIRTCDRCRRHVHLATTYAEWDRLVVRGACVAASTAGGLMVGTPAPRFAPPETFAPAAGVVGEGA